MPPSNLTAPDAEFVEFRAARFVPVLSVANGTATRGCPVTLRGALPPVGRFMSTVRSFMHDAHLCCMGRVCFLLVHTGGVSVSQQLGVGVVVPLFAFSGVTFRMSCGAVVSVGKGRVVERDIGVSNAVHYGPTRRNLGAC